MRSWITGVCAYVIWTQIDETAGLAESMGEKEVILWKLNCTSEIFSTQQNIYSRSTVCLTLCCSFCYSNSHFAKFTVCN